MIARRWLRPCGVALSLLLLAGSAFATIDQLEAARSAIRTKDFRKAAELLVASSTRDDHAALLLGDLYRAGLGVAQDDVQARHWIESAAEHGNSTAAYSMAAMLYRTDKTAAARWLQKAADGGHALARKAIANKTLPLEFRADRDLREADAKREAFWRAAAEDDVELLSLLADPELIKATDAFGRGALARASQRGAQRAIELLLQRGASANQSDAYACTPLMLASASGHLEAINKLLSADAPIDAKDRVGNTAAMYAAANGESATLRRLLDAGANARMTNVQGWSALDWAVYAQANESADLLRAKGLTSNRNVSKMTEIPSIPLRRDNTDVYRDWSDLAIASSRPSGTLLDAVSARANSDKPASTGPNPLLVSIIADSPTNAEKLIANGARPTLDEHTKHTPLIWAIKHQQLDVVRLLLAKGVDVNSHAGSEEPALLVAVRTGNGPMTELMLQSGADASVHDANGHTASMIAAANRQASLLSMLLAKSAVDAADKNGRTALWYAVSAHCEECVKALVSAKATIDKHENGDATPLAIAAARGDVGILEILLSAGADPNAVLRNDTSILMLAAASGSEPAIRRLISAKVAIDAQNKSGDTALIVATRSAQLSAVKALLSAGANRNMRNVDRLSALDLAKALGHQDLQALLL